MRRGSPAPSGWSLKARPPRRAGPSGCTLLARPRDWHSPCLKSGHAARRDGFMHHGFLGVGHFRLAQHRVTLQRARARPCRERTFSGGDRGLGVSSSSTRIGADDFVGVGGVNVRRGFAFDPSSIDQVSMQGCHGEAGSPYRVFCGIADLVGDTIWVGLMVQSASEGSVDPTAQTI